ncbi:hypothetical protein RFI_32798, partial [Reticulomyxa filosa]
MEKLALEYASRRYARHLSQEEFLKAYKIETTDQARALLRDLKVEERALNELLHELVSELERVETEEKLLQSMVQSKTGYNADNTNFIVNPMHLDMEIDLNMNENSKVGMPIVTSIASEQEKKDNNECNNKSKELDLLDDYSGDLLLKNILSQVLKGSQKQKKTKFVFNLLTSKLIKRLNFFKMCTK